MNPSGIDEQQLLTLLQDLIRIDSVNPSLVPGGRGEAEIARFIGDYLAPSGFQVHYQEAAAKRPNVIARLPGGGSGKSLMLNGHIDTTSTAGMEIDPLDPKCEEGKVYGRGSNDMKSGLAALITAAKYIADAGLRLKGDLIVAGVVDEEYASIGTEALVKEYAADAAILCEPTGLNIVTAHRGFAWSRVQVMGREVHGSDWRQGIDAIAKAGKLLVEVENLDRNMLRRQEHPVLGPASIHASLIQGGKELSTYPGQCEIQFERRTLPGETRATAADEMQDLIRRLEEQDREFQATCNVFFYRPALEVRQDQPIVQALAQAYERVLGESPTYGGSGGWMDSAILSEAGIPTAIFGPFGHGNHGPVEWVDLDSVVACTRILVETIVGFCGQE